MAVETPIEITHVAPRLRQDFTGKIPEALSGTLDEKEANFLSRALAAFALHKLAGCNLDEAASAIVDGGGDGGIDAVWYSDVSHKLWLVQSKYIREGRGEPSLGDVSKFKLGIENLLQGNFQAFSANAAWRALIPRLQAIFGDGSLEVRALLVYSGTATVSEDRRLMFDDLHNRFSPESDYLQFQTFNLISIHDWITGADKGVGIAEVELKLLKPGWLQQNYETIYGLVPLVDIANLYRQHGQSLIAANIRAYKGRTEVNEQIVSAAKDEPLKFVYLNNGLTAYCERLEVNNLDRANAEEKRVRAFGFSIVNGAQTLGSIACAYPNPAVEPQGGHVFLKVISLERCEDVDFAKRITRSTNFQNQIDDRDFVSLDEQQERIANQLILSGIKYHFKDGDDTPAPDDTNFTLDEATVACALLANSNDCDFCARVLSNRRSFWSFEDIYPESDLYRSRYSKIFRPDLSARTIWRAVQTLRAVKDALKTAETGVRKDFFENGRWLILAVIFLQLKSQQGNELTMTQGELDRIKQTAQDFSERLWSVCQIKGFVSASAHGGWAVAKHFRSVFSNPTDCQLLRDGLMANINQVQAV